MKRLSIIFFLLASPYAWAQIDVTLSVLKENSEAVRVLNYNPENLAHWVDLASGTEKYNESRDFEYFTNLTCIAGLDNRFTFDQMKAIVEKRETPDAGGYFDLDRISSAYVMLGRSGLPAALDMLKQRASFEFWRDKKMPTVTRLVNESPRVERTRTALGYALYGIGMHPSPQAEEFLKNCSEDSRYIDDEIFARELGSATGSRAHYQREYQIRQAAWKKRAELLISQGVTPEQDPTLAPFYLELSSVTPKPPAPTPPAVAAATPPGSTTITATTAALIGLMLIVAGGILLALRRR